MNNYNKYLGLVFLLLGGFLGLAAIVAIIIVVLRLLSVTLFNIPGFDNFFQYTILIIPYLIFFAGYYYLWGKLKLSKGKAARIIATIVWTLGTLFCFFTFVLTTINALGVKAHWLESFEEISHYYLVMHLAILFFTAAILASGDAKEKDWMDRGESGINNME